MMQRCFWAFNVILGYVRPRTLLIIMMMMCYMDFETLLQQLLALGRGPFIVGCCGRKPQDERSSDLDLVELFAGHAVSWIKDWPRPTATFLH